MKTVNLELSKALKEAGYPQEGYFYLWECVSNSEIEPILMHFQGNEKNKDYLNEDEDKFEYYASPTADEILDRLPEEIEKEKKVHRLRINKYLGDDGIVVYEFYYSYVWYDVEDFLVEVQDDKTIADAAAKMWLYLKKEGLL
jgi:hypothetical protein